MTLTIRPIEEDDAAEVIALWRACGLIRPWNDPAADIAFARASADAEILVGVRDGRVAASVLCGSDGHRGWFYYLAVDPNRRGGGLGRRIMAAAEQWLRVRGVRKVQLMIRPENSKVQAFYEALDYRVEPRIVMSRRLETDDT